MLTLFLMAMYRTCGVMLFLPLAPFLAWEQVQWAKSGEKATSDYQQVFSPMMLDKSWGSHKNY